MLVLHMMIVSAQSQLFWPQAEVGETLLQCRHRTKLVQQGVSMGVQFPHSSPLCATFTRLADGNKSST